MTRLVKNFALPILALGMLGFAIWHVLFAEEKRPDLTPPKPPPAVSLGFDGIGAVGVVEPESESVQLGAAQTGIVIEAFVTSAQAGQRVAKDAPLFRVDDRQLKAQLGVNQANLKSAQAQLRRLENMPRPEDVEPLAARVRVAEATVKQWDDKVQRSQQLKSDAIAREEVAQRKLSLDVAQAERGHAEAELARIKAGAWEQDLEVARAAVAVAQANVDYVQTEIERCLVRAPLDASILQVNVRVGEHVSGASAKALVVLGKVDRLHVRVDVDEQEIPRFQAGAAAKAFARGNAQTEIPLAFVRVEPYVVPKRMLSGDAAERVDTRVLQAIFAIESANSPLHVGQQLDVFIATNDSR